MKKLKLCVYAIAKNESQFVDRWVDSMSEADKIYVLDTGSTDDTVEKLRNRGVEVLVKKIEPWRFDVARNESLKMVSDEYDICVCTDLDEVFEKGWYQEMVNSWNENTTRLSYNYIWNFDSYGKPGTSFYIDKTHANKAYKWVNPVHEVLVPINNINEVISVSNALLKHYPDPLKSRGSYLGLLELSVKEDPTNDRNMHYLGREYMFKKEYEKSIETLLKHLDLPNSKWKDERAASMRYIARSYIALKKIDDAIDWYKNAIIEAPYLREGYTELGYLYYKNKDYKHSKYYLEMALNITSKPNTYICEAFAYNETIYDILSIDSYYVGDLKSAITYASKALEINPSVKRIQDNLELYKKNYKVTL